MAQQILTFLRHFKNLFSKTDLLDAQDIRASRPILRFDFGHLF